MSQLPKIQRVPEPHYSINKSMQMQGKTIVKVECGSRQDFPGVHASEVIILHFSDGSILSIDTGSNAQNIADRYDGLNAEDFHASFHLHWVPSTEQKPKI